VPDCPVVPGLDPNDYGPGETKPGWDPDVTDPPQPGFDAVHNTQRCKFNIPCTGGVFLKPGDPLGNPTKAVCRIDQPTDCPPSVSGGGAWIRMQPFTPLLCYWDPQVGVQTTPQCPTGFFPVEPSVAGSLNDLNHVLCI
jgi:hypothetical protein